MVSIDIIDLEMVTSKNSLFNMNDTRNMLRGCGLNLERIGMEVLSLNGNHA